MAATVLVVEDERKLRDLVRSYLERAGFTVLSTGSGAEAISMATSAVTGPGGPRSGVAGRVRRDGGPRAQGHVGYADPDVDGQER